jgi:hypothetical protein
MLAKVNLDFFFKFQLLILNWVNIEHHNFFSFNKHSFYACHHDNFVFFLIQSICYQCLYFIIKLNETSLLDHLGL